MNDADLTALTQNFSAYAAERFEQLKTEISSNIDTQGKRASGRTQDSMLVDVQPDRVTLWIRKFFGALETGSEPWSGKTGEHCTFEEFQDIIADWIVAKGVDVIDIDEASYFIARKIINEGTKQYREGRIDDVYSTATTQALQDVKEQTSHYALELVTATTTKWINEIKRRN